MEGNHIKENFCVYFFNNFDIFNVFLFSINLYVCIILFRGFLKIIDVDRTNIYGLSKGYIWFVDFSR